MTARQKRAAVRAAQLATAKRYIDDHLRDPRLAPQRAAQAVGISLRQLHHLFAADGVSFAQFVRRRRLDGARAELMSPLSQNCLVGEIARAWGFNSIATFYRTFASAFGVAPNALRIDAVREAQESNQAGAE